MKETTFNDSCTMLYRCYLDYSQPISQRRRG